MSMFMFVYIHIHKLIYVRVCVHVLKNVLVHVPLFLLPSISPYLSPPLSLPSVSFSAFLPPSNTLYFSSLSLLSIPFSPFYLGPSAPPSLASFSPLCLYLSISLSISVIPISLIFCLFPSISLTLSFPLYISSPISDPLPFVFCLFQKKVHIVSVLSQDSVILWMSSFEKLISFVNLIVSWNCERHVNYPLFSQNTKIVSLPVLRNFHERKFRLKPHLPAWCSSVFLHAGKILWVFLCHHVDHHWLVLAVSSPFAVCLTIQPGGVPFLAFQVAAELLRKALEEK